MQKNIIAEPFSHPQVRRHLGDKLDNFRNLKEDKLAAAYLDSTEKVTTVGRRAPSSDVSRTLHTARHTSTSTDSLSAPSKFELPWYPGCLTTRRYPQAPSCNLTVVHILAHLHIQCMFGSCSMPYNPHSLQTLPLQQWTIHNCCPFRYLPFNISVSSILSGQPWQ